LLFDEIRNITFEASPAMERGGCVIETNFGTVDAQIKHLDEEIDKILNLTPRPFEEEIDMDDELEETESDGS
jgi:flagellar biosynthesis/type III secretory pathway protein FliH